MEKRKRSLAIDMLSGSMWDKILLYALPVAATGILGQLFNASDVAIVGNFASTDRVAAVAAVGANGPVIGLVLNLFIGIALGANVVIANAIGRGDRETVSRAVHTSIVASVLGGFIVMLIGQLLAKPVLLMLNVPDDVFPLAMTYMRIYLLGLPVIFLYNFESAIFRSVGDTKTPLIALAVSGILNVLLNVFFVTVLDMTVDGVAVATVIANLVSSLILGRKLLKSELSIHIDFKALRIDWKILWRILKIGLPAGIQSAVFSLSNIIISSAGNSLGKVTMAASSAGFNVEIENAASDSYTKDYVIATSPVAGEQLSSGSTVYITVSAGPEIQYVSMPNLVGSTEDSAISRIESSNLSYGGSDRVVSDYEAGTVIDQSISSSESVAEHTKVYLTVSSGPQG